MIEIDAILSGTNPSEVISQLKRRTTLAPNWSLLVKDYEPKLHKIYKDHQGRKDKIHEDGTRDLAARLAVGLEKLLTKRMTEFTFAIPVKRTYGNIDTDAQKAIVNAIERIYAVAHIDSENKRRGLNYYAGCEALTIWYTKRERHGLYGFPCDFKLKCRTFSPMEDTKLYPLIDEYGEMYAMSFEYRKRVKDEWVTFFETYTKDRHYVWRSSDKAEWEEVLDGEEFDIGKIPAVYIYRPRPIWDGLCRLREDIEYTISRNSDVLAYNCAPILKVAGSIIGEEQKGETRRIYRVMEGGDVSYVSWAQSIAALEYHIKTLLNLFFMQAQIPDISFENIRNLGNIGYDARKMLFTDAHMKVGDESGPLIEFLEREGNVIKAFLKKLNVNFREDDIDAVQIEHTITPFIQEDDMLNINKWKSAGGDVPLVSPLEAISNAGLSDNPEKTYADIISYKMMQASAQNPQPEGGGEVENITE